MNIGEVARRCGVSPDTIRHYEKCGLLPGVRRGPNGYRLYDDASVRRVEVIRGALALGFTLRELAQLLAARDSGRPPCGRVRALAEEKLTALDVRIESMTRFRAQLRDVVDQWDQRLARTTGGAPAHLLESLVAATNTKGRP